MAKKKSGEDNPVNGSAGDMVRAPAELLYAEEIELLIKEETRRRLAAVFKACSEHSE